VLQRVIDKLGLDLTPAELAPRITASVAQSTVIIDLEARDHDPRVAQEIAQADAEQLARYIQQVETPAKQNVAPIKATITDSARFDANPVSPRTDLNLAVAGVLGLLLGCALALLRDVTDTSVKTVEDIAGCSDAPVMAHVAFDPSVPRTPLLTDAGTHVPRAEAFRVLRTNLQFLDPDAPPRSFLITSAVPGEGKSSTATNLAITLAQAGKKVLLVDGDLRRPSIATMLGLEGAVGLTTVLVGRSDLEASIQLHRESGVHVLTGGPVPPNPSEILQSHATRDLLARLRAMYDLVVIDAPPLLPVADAAITAAEVDGAIVVVRHGKTTREQLRHSLERLEQVGARTFGVVVNMTPRRRQRGYYGYEYGYGYGYTPLAQHRA
jgi:receptor protein-tyrosine kinase